jgi:hypothetical protein
MSDGYITRRRGLGIISTLLLSGCVKNKREKIFIKKVEIRNYRNKSQKFQIQIFSGERKLVSEKITLSGAGGGDATIRYINGSWSQEPHPYKIIVRTPNKSETITASYLLGILDDSSYSGPPCLDLTFDAERGGDLGFAFGGELNCGDSTDAR